MRSRVMSILLVVVLFCFATHTHAEEAAIPAPIDSSATSLPTIFIDCSLCDNSDMDFFKTNLPFVVFVRDKAFADIFVVITSQNTGSGGSVVTITLTGQRSFAGTVDTVAYVSQNSETNDSLRKGVAHRIRLSLVRFVEKSPLAKHLNVSYDRPAPTTVSTDAWHSWVFTVEASPWFDGEQLRHEWSLWGQLSARRVTRDVKTYLSVYGQFYSKTTYPTDSTVSYSRRHSKEFDASNFWSLTDHWSWGLATSVWNNTWGNTRSAVYGAAAIEYNIFPYDESTRRQLRLGYRIGGYYKEYLEETIYGKLDEWLASEKISASLTIIQPFGSASAEIVGIHYFHDFDRNRVEFNTNCSFRIVKGLSLNFNGYYSRIHDQLSLVKGSATQEEISSQLRELATSYRYSGSVSLSYSFGSMYNNVVNARFGN